MMPLLWLLLPGNCNMMDGQGKYLGGVIVSLGILTTHMKVMMGALSIKASAYRRF